MSGLMTWEQKLAALIALTSTFDVSLRMRAPGDWYVDQHGVEIKEREGSGVLSRAAGNGDTPEEAVEDHWRCHTEIGDGYLVLHAMGPDRRHVRWNGFMWADLDVPKVAR